VLRSKCFQFIVFPFCPTPFFFFSFDKHNELDQKIKNLESGIEKATNLEIEMLKKEKLHLKDELFNILKSKN